MNVYCKSCKKEMEIAEDLGSEIYVFDCGCTEVDGLREALDIQTRRIVLLRGALELIENSSDTKFVQRWAAKHLADDVETSSREFAAPAKKAGVT
jgi:hypothetical protein